MSASGRAGFPRLTWRHGVRRESRTGRLETSRARPSSPCRRGLVLPSGSRGGVRSPVGPGRGETFPAVLQPGICNNLREGGATKGVPTGRASVTSPAVCRPIHTRGAAETILSGEVSGLCKAANNPEKSREQPGKNGLHRLRVYAQASGLTSFHFLARTRSSGRAVRGSAPGDWACGSATFLKIIGLTFSSQPPWALAWQGP